MVLPVVAQALVEGTILFLGNVLRVASPQRLSLIEFLVLDLNLLNLLGLLLRLVFLILDLLDLGLVLALGNFLVIFNLLYFWKRVRIQRGHAN